MIDFHCHLDLYPNPLKVIEIIDSAGCYVLSVTTTPKAWAKTNLLSKGRSKIRTALGLHPQIAHQRINEIPLFQYLIRETKYVGEVGLDGGADLKQHQTAQLTVFREILRISAKAGGKILSVHSRKAESQVLDTLAGFPDAGLPVLHWFTGSKKELQRAIDMGCWFSVGPAMIKSKNGKSIVRVIPKERILLESDGPFVKINNRSALPTDTELVINELQKLWGIPKVEVNQILFQSFRNLCKIGNDYDNL